MHLLWLAQASQSATDSSGGWFGGLSCVACAVLGFAGIAGLVFVSSRLQQWQVRKDAAAAYRGIQEEKRREEQEGRNPPPPQA